ncbi:hypothetical protein BEN71_14090 [Acinetobacter wuhouensis]|uniref:hypothetical protein n=1 Tax=Acinetobacter wuhouensis TaxID=1879050 RepID=UPI00083AEA5B|nr:hypothetical protein [Acinetobacter wuhouensis]AXQ23137.1 hypothetical protein BEN71_14090 [Acinetobacter wuhouensis]
MLKVKFRPLIAPLALSSYLLCMNEARADLCDSTELVDKVIAQTEIANREQARIACKIDPTNTSNVIMAYAQWIPVKDEPESGTYYLTLLKFDRNNQQVNYRYLTRKAIVSDAISLDSIELDTANYKISNQQRALGVRLNYSGHSQPNPYSMTLLNLYDLQNKQQVLDSLIVERYRAETDTRCNADVEERKSILRMLNSSSKNYYDIQVKTTAQKSKFRGTYDHCHETKQNPTKQIMTLKFDGKQYQIPTQYKDDYVY